MAVSNELGRGIRPDVARRGDDELAFSGTLVPGAVEREPDRGLWLGTGSGRLAAVPTELDEEASRAEPLVRGGAAVIADAATRLDLVVRPLPSGIATMLFLRDATADRSVSWRVDLPGGERVERTPKGGAAVLAPVAETEPRATGRTTPSRNDAAASEGISPLDDRLGGAYSRSAGTGQRVMATVSAPLVLDRRGRSVRGSLTAEGDVLSLSVDPPRSTRYPLLARLDWMPAGKLGNGWFAYGVDRPLKRSKYRIEGKQIEGLGCAAREGGTLGPGEESRTRQVATLEPDACPSLVETGTP